LELRILGPIEVVGDDGARRVVPRQQRRLLAALIAQAGNAVPVDALIEALWGESPPPSAAKLAQVYVSQLRKILPAPCRIETRASGYRLDLGTTSLDAARFEQLLAEGKAASREENPALGASRLRRALGLWRGPAFGEFAYEEFARQPSARLEELRLAALEERIDAELALGRDAEVLSELIGLATKEPLRERLQAQLMLALYRSGRQVEALEVYARTRSRLLEELGLDPGQELELLQRRILQQDRALEVPPNTRPVGPPLPVPANALLGRERELAELRGLLLRDNVRLVVMTGAGGSGKTRLALEVARMTAASFAQGAVFVDLSAVGDAESLLRTISRALGVPGPTGESIDDLAAALRSRELLLLLDNAEQLRGSAAAFTQLLANAPDLTLLVTSRVVLHLSGEYVYPVQPLGEEPALALFIERAGQAGAVVRDDGPELATLRLICERLDRLPLAIELAAGRASALTPQALLARLEPRLPLLTGGPRDLPARQQTLRATIDWTFEMLTPAERGLFVGLAVFANGCTLEGAEEVAGASPDDLQSLVEHNLLRHEAGRYSMFETIREYALERLDASEAAKSIRDRHAQYFLRLVEQAEPELGGERQAELLELIDQESYNLRTALRWSLGHGPREIALRIAGALAPFWYRRGHLSEGRQWLAATLSASGDGGHARAKALRGASIIASLQLDWAAAARWSKECHRLSLEIGDAEGAAASLLTLGRASLGEGHRGRARSLFTRAALLAEEPGVTRTTAAMAAFSLGYAALTDGEYAEARNRLGAARSAFSAVEDQYGVARSLAALGAVAVHQGRTTEALAHLRESLRLSRTIGDRDDIAWALELAGAALADSRSQQASELLGAAEALRETVGISLEGAELVLHQRAMAAIQGALSPEVAAAHWSAGRDVPLERAVDRALAAGESRGG
jgi:predicted ATPase/DNA-binding SARP family transcriptional activator